MTDDLQATAHPPRLQEADNFKGFKVTIAGDKSALAALQAGFAPAGKLENEQHAWVREDWLRANAPMASDPAWQDGLRKMLDYAKSKGWVGSDGIRAHVEWV